MKNDNKGMTLVELLAAIAILAIVTTPFLNSFLASARNNQKARNTLRATAVAQNLMEGIEAFSLEEICTQINQEAVKSKLYLPHGYEAHAELGNERGETSGVVVDGKYTFSETPSHTYCFAIKGIEEDGNKYDARVWLDASGYRENQEENGLNYNENYSLDIQGMNETTDVIFVVTKEEEEKIFLEAGWNPVDDWVNVERCFLVVAEQDGEKRESEKVSVSLEYRYKDGSLETKVLQGKSLVKTVSTLKNVFIMYYPNYASTDSDILDRFEVELKQEKEFDLCIIKQKYDSFKAENNYVTFLDVTDTVNVPGEDEKRVTLRTNIGKNLYEESDEIRQGALRYRYTLGAVLSESKAREKLGFVEQTPQTLLGQGKKNEPIFKTTVQIYPSGTYDGVNAFPFEQAEPLARLTNE